MLHVSCISYRVQYYGMLMYDLTLRQVKYFDKKRVFDEYKKKLEEQGYQPLPAEDEDPKR